MNATGESLPDQAELRQRIRAMRMRLDAPARRDAAAAVAEILERSMLYQGARFVAGYHAVGGELSPGPVLRQAHAAGKTVYLPLLDRETPRRLLFAQWRPGMPTRENRFGIPEPVNTPRRDARELDLVLAPLVASDRRGNRVGMGGGFYDTTFGFRREKPNRGPRLVGLAYGFQVVPRIEPQPWDVPVDFLLTPEGLIDCRSDSDIAR